MHQTNPQLGPKQAAPTTAGMPGIQAAMKADEAAETKVP